MLPMTMDSLIFRKSKMGWREWNKKSPMRMCVGCHEMREKKENRSVVLKMQDNTFCIDAAGTQETAAEHICAKEDGVSGISSPEYTDWNVRSK